MTGTLPGIEVPRLPVKSAGPKGLAPYQPRVGSKNSAILTAASEVVEFYRAQDRLPLGSREVGYVLTGDAYGYAKPDIDLVEEVLERARRAGIIDQAAISDGRTAWSGPWRVVTPDEIVDSAIEELTRAQLDRQAGQAYRVEVWAEAAAWIARLAPMCAERGVEVYSGSGSVPWDAVWRAAARALNGWLKNDGQPTVIFQIGDLDLHGLRNIARPFEADVVQTAGDLFNRRFLREPYWRASAEQAADIVSVRRLLLTAAQVEEHVGQRARDYGLTAEDRKAGWPWPYKVQAEALAPEIRDQIVIDALDAVLDAELRDDVITAEGALHEEAREQLRQRLEEEER